MILAAMASLTLWNAKILRLLLKVECGSVALVTTDLLSPNIYDLDLMGTPRYLRVYLISMICSVAVLAATNLIHMLLFPLLLVSWSTSPLEFDCKSGDMQ